MKNQDEFAVQDIAAIQKHIISIRNVHANWIVTWL